MFNILRQLSVRYISVHIFTFEKKSKFSWVFILNPNCKCRYNCLLFRKCLTAVIFVNFNLFQEEDIENFKNIALAAREFKRLSFSPTSRKWSPEGFSPNSQKWSQEGTSSNSQKWSHEGTSPTSQKWTQEGTSPGNLPRSQSWSRTDPSSPLKVPRPQNGATWM